MGLARRNFFSPKNGKQDYIEAKKFRPKTLLSVIGKLFELFIAARLNWILSRNNALDDNHEGFRGGRGTSRMLYKIFSDIDGINYQTRQALLVGIDLEKTFDSVDVNLMTIKLTNAAVVGKLAQLIHDYLSSRAIRIQISDTVSPQFSCELGLTQRSILSPLLFIIFIILRDLSKRFGNHHLNFHRLGTTGLFSTLNCQSDPEWNPKTKLETQGCLAGSLHKIWLLNHRKKRKLGWLYA